MTTNTFVGLPAMPDKVVPKSTNRTLMASVRTYFYQLYNAGNGMFKKYLASVNNKTAITKNRMFDRAKAVDMIVVAADKADDKATAEAAPGEIYRCIVHIMNGHEALRLKSRRAEYQRLQHQPAAAE